MIRKVSRNAYYVHPTTIARNFGGWDAGLYRTHAASAGHEKAMQIFRKRRAPVPLHPKQRHSKEW